MTNQQSGFAFGFSSCLGAMAAMLLVAVLGVVGFFTVFDVRLDQVEQQVKERRGTGGKPQTTKIKQRELTDFNGGQPYLLKVDVDDVTLDVELISEVEWSPDGLTADHCSLMRIENPSDRDFVGSILLVFKDGSGFGWYADSESCQIPADEVTTLSIHSLLDVADYRKITQVIPELSLTIDN